MFHLARAVGLLQGRDISPAFLYVNGLVATANLAPYKLKDDATLPASMRDNLALPSMQPMLQMLSRRYRPPDECLYCPSMPSRHH